MNVLGISALDNDANAALFVDGRLKYAMGEERLSRRKLHKGFPGAAVREILDSAGLRPSDIDVVWLNGYGWPADKGGPMFYGDMIGAGAVLATMEKLAPADPRYAPAATLKELAASGGRFVDIDKGGLRVG